LVSVFRAVELRPYNNKQIGFCQQKNPTKTDIYFGRSYDIRHVFYQAKSVPIFNFTKPFLVLDLGSNYVYTCGRTGDSSIDTNNGNIPQGMFACLVFACSDINTLVM